MFVFEYVARLSFDFSLLFRNFSPTILENSGRPPSSSIPQSVTRKPAAQADVNLSWRRVDEAVNNQGKGVTLQKVPK